MTLAGSYDMYCAIRFCEFDLHHVTQGTQKSSGQLAIKFELCRPKFTSYNEHRFQSGEEWLNIKYVFGAMNF